MFDTAIRLNDSDGPIVMVDDNADDTRTATRCHQRSKVENSLICFDSGEAFLAHLEEVAAGAEPMPALVLLDIRMPRMDGFEVLSTIRSQDPFRAVPVVMMLTNSDYQRDVERAQKLGANGYREKPSRIAEYVEFFDSLVA